MSLASRIRSVAPSATLGLTAKAKALRAQGIDLIAFTAGEPDFDTPEPIKEAAMEALRKGDTKYTPASGTEDLKRAIVDRIEADLGVRYEPGQVVVSCGAKHALYNLFQVLLEPGDEVIIISPYWLSYPEIVRLASGVPVVVETTLESGFVPDPAAVEEKVSPRTRALILNSPSNPTGAVVPRSVLEELGALVLRHQLLLVTDEIYDKLLYDGLRHESPVTLSEELRGQTVLVNGASKTYAMTGWRLGWAVGGPQEITKAMGVLQSHSTSNPTSFAQPGAIAALTGPQDAVEAMRREFEKRRNVMMDGLESIPGVSVFRPQGAFYVFPSVAALLGKSVGDKRIGDSMDLAAHLLEEARVVVVPGGPFGCDHAIRLSFATSPEAIEEGLSRLRRELASLVES